MIKLIFYITVLSICCSLSAEQTDEFKQKFQEYKSKYNFYSIQDTMYTIHSELNLPDGFSHVEPKDSTSYTYWISNFPLWHQYKAVGNWKGGKSFEYGEVSRVVHLPWSGPVFRDVAIPVRLIGEYLLETNNRFGLQIMPKQGKIFTYKKWLEGKPVYSHLGELFFKEGISKENNENEYYKALLFIMQNVSFESIAKSCDTVSVGNLQPGDMYIAYNNSGKIGKLYTILHLISNESDDIKYLVATGCADACDFHIPKINDDRDNPWIDLSQLKELAQGFKFVNFYRFKPVLNFKNNN